MYVSVDPFCSMTFLIIAPWLYQDISNQAQNLHSGKLGMNGLPSKKLENLRTYNNAFLLQSGFTFASAGWGGQALVI